MKEIYVFGVSCYSEILHYYETSELENSVAGYTINQRFITGKERLNAPLVPYEELIARKNEISILIGIGYNDMNNIRKKVYEQIKADGIEILSFIHPTAIIAGNAELGESTVILENAVIQPFVKMGIGNIVWSNATIAHHAKIGDYNFFATGCTVAGNGNISNNCFLGTNCTIRDDVYIAPYSLIGAGAYINKDTPPESVFSVMGAEARSKKSSEFHTV